MLAELACGLHGAVQLAVLALGAAGRHPVRGKLDEFRIDVGRGDVGHRLADRHAHGRLGAEHGKRRPLADRHRLALEAAEVQIRDGAVGDRNLPGADHLVAAHKAAHGAVADRDEEGLVANGGMAQNLPERFAHRHAAGVKGRVGNPHALHVPVHAGRLAKEHLHRHVDRRLLALAALHDELSVSADVAQNRVRAALALAEVIKELERGRINGDRIALLGLVAPDFQRAHALFLDRHLLERKPCAVSGNVRQLGHGVRQPARSDVMNGKNRIAVPALPAAVDHFLSAALHLGIAALHGVKVKALGVRAGGHGGSGPAPEADAHARPPEHDHERSGRQSRLDGLVLADVADAACEHDGLVIAVARGADPGLECTEVAEDVRAAEFIVEGRGADRPLGHDLAGRGDAARGSVHARGRSCGIVGVAVVLPVLPVSLKVQGRNGEAAKAGLGPGSAPRCALVANFAARARGGSGERADRRRMVVRFDLEDGVAGFKAFLEYAAELVLGTRTRIHACHRRPLEHGRVVRIGNDRALRSLAVRLADHAEERLVLLDAVDREFGIEDLVAAVLGVGLRKHHELDIRRVAPLALECINEVVDLVVRKRKAHLEVRLGKRHAAAVRDVHDRHGLARDVGKERFGRSVRRKHGLGHAVVQAGGKSLNGLRVKRHLIGKFNAVEHGALDALDGAHAAVVDDVGRLGRPGADGPQARHDQKLQVGAHVGRLKPVVKERREPLAVPLAKLSAGKHEMHVAAGNRRHGRIDGLKSGQKPVCTELGKRARTDELEHHGILGHE